MRKLFLLILLVLDVVLAGSQDFSLSGIPFIEEGNDVTSPYSGGFRSPQFGTVDLNVDGVDDVVVFDRDGNVFVPFLRQDDELVFDPSYREIFPNIKSWVLFRDFNQDGIQDIFCAPVEVGIPGVAVYQGVIEGGTLSYDLVRFPERDFNILYFPIGSTVTQVFVSVIDMPEVRDFDSDGDLDIIAFEPSGFSAYLYRNIAIESGFTSDTLIYVLDENCYGGFIESGFSQDVTLSPDAGVCATSFVRPQDLPAEVRHAGSTILSYDLTGNGLQDLLLGDISYNSLVMLSNKGTLETTHFTDQLERFEDENGEDVSIELYLNAFVEDFDGDGQDEMVVSPHERFGAQTKDHIWRYRINEPTDTTRTFTLLQKDFLIDRTLYPGTLTVPEFCDANGDGLMDILVGTEGQSADGISIDPRIYFYKNIGTPTDPSFELSSTDFLEFAAFSTTSSSFAPACGDIDGDGDDDLVIGDNNGALYYVENISDLDVHAYANPVYEAFGVRVGAHARPEIFDVNDDGLGDLIIGEQNFNSVDGEIGSLNYFENIGSPGNPLFDPEVNNTPNDPLFGGINLREEGFINNHSAPAVATLGPTVYVGTGSDQGFIHLYSYEEGGHNEDFELISDRLGSIREGGRSAIDLYDLDLDEHAELVVGTRRGGIAIYKTSVVVDIIPSAPLIASNLGFVISPNPTRDILSVAHDEYNLAAANFTLYSLNGESLYKGRNASSIDVSSFPEGVYVISIELDDLVVTDRFVKIQ